MNLTILATLLFIIFVGLISIIYSRGNIVLLFLLPASNFLGFINPMDIAEKGLFDIHAFILLVNLLAIIYSAQKFKELKTAIFLLPLLIYFMFWCYGIVLPVVDGNSSYFYSIKASKEFLTMFTYFSVFLFLKTKRDVNLGWIYLIGLGIYYSLLELIGQFAGSSMASFIVYDLRKEGTLFWKIYPPFWPVILVALFINYYKVFMRIAKSYFMVIMSFFGILLTFFRSYLLSIFVVVPLVLVLTSHGLYKITSRILILVATLCLSILVISFSMGYGLDSFEKISDDFVLSGVRELTSHSGGSLVGRERVSKARTIILNKRPYLGYGFIDKDSQFGIRNRKFILGDNLGFIDKGVLDIPIKFGYSGFLLLMFTVFRIIYSLINMSKTAQDMVFKARCMTVASILMVYVIVLPVHSPFTYSYSLLPLGISLGLIERELYLLSS